MDTLTSSIKPAERIKQVDMKWAVSIHATNDVMGEGMFFLELAAALKEYAPLLEAWEAGQKPCEAFVTPRGTRLIVIGSCYSEEPVLLSEHRLTQQAQ